MLSTGWPLSLACYHHSRSICKKTWRSVQKEKESCERVEKNVVVMDAITFLIERRWKSPKAVGIVLLAVTILSWLNFKLAALGPQVFASVDAFGIIHQVWPMVTALAYIGLSASIIGVAVLVPLFTIYKLSNTLRTWITQRAVEEMCCTGLTARYLLDQMVFFGVKWCVAAAVPAGLTMALASDVGFNYWWGVILGGYILAGLVGTYLTLYMTAWRASSRSRGVLPLLGSMLVVTGIPIFGIYLAEGSLASWVIAGLYTIITARAATIYALENPEALNQFNNKVRRTLRRRKPAGTVKELSPNPILAREQMRGHGSSEILTLLTLVVAYVIALVSAFESGESGGFGFVVFFAVFGFSYRAASKMSQIVTEEIECTTLETIRSTPMGSQTFLKGWLHIVLRQAWLDTSILFAAIFPVILAIGDGAVLLEPALIMVVLASYAMPYLGALVGASIAGQGKRRDEISGQLLLSVGAITICGAPQAVVAAHSMPLLLAVVSSALAFAFMCWLLSAGAEKSLNRVFLPQK